MRKNWKIPAVWGLCILLSGSVTAYGEVGKSLHPVVSVTAQEDYSHIAVSQVSDYVNIREQPTTSSRIVGKIYNNCAAVIEETVEGQGGTWYRIQSGTVTESSIFYYRRGSRKTSPVHWEGVCFHYRRKPAP